MTDFNEKDNLTENGDITETENEDIESTVFSAPKEHKQKKPQKAWVKSLVIIIVAVLCLGILVAGLIYVTKNYKKKDDENYKNGDGNNASSDSVLKETEVLNIKTSEIKTVTVENQNGTYTVYAEKDNGEDSVSSESEEALDDMVFFYLKDVDKSLQNPDKAGELVSSVSVFNAKMEITKLSLKDCGLDKPSATVKIVKADGKTVSFTVGNDSKDSMGCYLKLSDSDKIYLVDSNVKEALDFDEFYFASTENMPTMTEFDGASDYFEDGSLVSFDKVTVKGKGFSDGLTVVPNDNKTFSEFIGYKITEPEEHYADNVDSIISLFSSASGISVSGAYSYDTSEASLKRFGLDNPDITASMQILSKTLTYKFKLTENGDYAAYCNNGKLIYKVDSTSIDALVDKKAADYYSPLICLYPIDKLKSLTVKNGDKSYKFDIRSNDDEETNADIKYIIGLGNKDIDCKSFQNVYQYMISLSCNDFTVDNVKSSPKVSLIFGVSSGDNIKVDFVKISEAKYQYYINERPMGKLAISKITKLIKNVEKLANGEKIGELG